MNILTLKRLINI